MSVQVQGSQGRPLTGDPAAPSAPPGDSVSTSPPNAAPTESPERPVSVPPSPRPEPLPEVPAGGRRRSLFSKRVILPLLAVVVIIGALFVFNLWHEGQTYVSTDNAQLTGQPVQIGSVNAGRVDFKYSTLRGLSRSLQRKSAGKVERGSVCGSRKLCELRLKTESRKDRE